VKCVLAFEKNCNGEKNYFNKYNRLDIIIFRLEIMFLWLSVSSAKVVGSNPREHTY